MSVFGLFSDAWEAATFLSIPIVASLIGYGTNVLAIQMTFLPLDYIGFYEAAFRRCGYGRTRAPSKARAGCCGARPECTPPGTTSVSLASPPHA